MSAKSGPNAAISKLKSSPQVRKAAKKARSQAVVAAKKLGVYEKIRQARNPGAGLQGMVEEFSARQTVGWVAVPPGADPVRVTLHLNSLEVGATWAVDPMPGRQGWGEIRSFRFRTKDVWQYARTSGKVVVKADGKALPINGRGMFARPHKNGGLPQSMLKERLASGWVFSSEGVLQLSKKLDTEWQAQVLGLYDQVRQVLKEAHGYDGFAIYGSLLGAVREGGFIGHDFDFDMAYVSPHAEGRKAADEMKALAFTFIDRGFDVDCRRTALHIHHHENPETRIDLFHLYFDNDGVLSFPFGVAGEAIVRREDWAGVKEVPFAGRQVAVPSCAEKMVEAIYGANWRTPKPGFEWGRDRRTRATAGTIGIHTGQEVYWANFYARTEYTEGSTFFEFVNGRDDTPATIIDIGCGDGRDSFAFASSAAARRVFGMDRSHIGVKNAGKKAEVLGIADRATFHVCDVGDVENLKANLNEAFSASPDAPVMFYLRFFLHSIPEEVQNTLMDVLGEVARPGDMFAAEFRTTKDEAIQKVHGNHYRRFQDGPAFGRALADKHGFEVLFEVEGTGLSPYKGEDPELYRVIARRR
jgi:hypothetical protein